MYVDTLCVTSLKFIVSHGHGWSHDYHMTIGMRLLMQLVSTPTLLVKEKTKILSLPRSTFSLLRTLNKGHLCIYMKGREVTQSEVWEMVQISQK